jgi:hypothetical protein
MLGAAALALTVAPRGPAPASAVESSAYEELFNQEREGSQPPLGLFRHSQFRILAAALHESVIR